MRATGTPLPRSNLKDLVASHVRDMIFSGKLRPGDKVHQDEVAAQLGVSKLPVREALISLENEALVRNLPRRGAFIAPLTQDDVRDHYRIYGLLSAIAAERAAIALSDGDLDELEELLDQMESPSMDPEELEELNFEFHRRINLAGGSNRLSSVLRLLADSIPTRFYQFTTGWNELAAGHHREILTAFRARDPEAASRAMADHLTIGGDHAVRSLLEAGFWSPETAGDSRE